MSLAVSTSDPSGLLTSIRRAIDQGHIVTWSYDSDGDFTHTPPQWARKAWLRPSTSSGVLALSQINPQGATPTTELKGVYHGRFTEMLLAHFDNRIGSVTAV